MSPSCWSLLSSRDRALRFTARYAAISALVGMSVSCQSIRGATETEMPQLESYLVYPEEMKSVARVQVFRDFLIQKAQRWTY